MSKGRTRQIERDEEIGRLLLFEQEQHVAREPEHGVDRFAPGTCHLGNGVKDLEDQRHSVDRVDRLTGERPSGVKRFRGNSGDGL